MAKENANIRSLMCSIFVDFFSLSPHLCLATFLPVLRASGLVKHFGRTGIHRPCATVSVTGLATVQDGKLPASRGRALPILLFRSEYNIGTFTGPVEKKKRQRAKREGHPRNLNLNPSDVEYNKYFQVSFQTSKVRLVDLGAAQEQAVFGVELFRINKT